MSYIFAVVLIGLLIGLIIFQRKKNIRLLDEFKNSMLLKDLLDHGYTQVNEKLTGNHQGYQTGFYYSEDSRSGLIGYATIDCDIPFIKTNGAVKEMMDFSKKYNSSGFVIDSKTGFCKELNVDFLLNSGQGEILKIYKEMVFVAEKEGFTSSC